MGNQPTNGPYTWGNGPKPKSKLAILLEALIAKKGKKGGKK
jgi:hypothetical protein